MSNVWYYVIAIILGGLGAVLDVTVDYFVDGKTEFLLLGFIHAYTLIGASLSLAVVSMLWAFGIVPPAAVLAAVAGGAVSIVVAWVWGWVVPLFAPLFAGLKLIIPAAAPAPKK